MWLVAGLIEHRFSSQLEQIMLAPNESFCVSSLAALREVNSLKSNMTKSQAEATLQSFVAKGWLVKSRSVNVLSAPPPIATTNG